MKMKDIFAEYSSGLTLFFLFALSLDVLAVCALIRLDVFETPLAVPYGIEFRS